MTDEAISPSPRRRRDRFDNLRIAAAWVLLLVLLLPAALLLSLGLLVLRLLFGSK